MAKQISGCLGIDTWKGVHDDRKGACVGSFAAFRGVGVGHIHNVRDGGKEKDAVERLASRDSEEN